MTTDERLLLEEQILSLLLKHKEAIEEFCRSPHKDRHFDERHRLILSAILEHFNQNVTLTRRSYREYVKKIGKKTNEILAEEMLYNKLTLVAGVKLDDMPMLLSRLKDAYLLKEGIALIEEYRKACQQDVVLASKDLGDKINAAISDVETNSIARFDSIGSEEYRSGYKAEFEGRFNPDTLIECGLPEIDEVMGRGFSAGDLTVVCADTGGFKCLAPCYINTYDNGIAWLPDLYRLKQEKGAMALPALVSLNQNGQLVRQQPLDIVDNGVQQVWTITTRTGRSITSTGNHRHMSFSKFVSTSEYHIGDSIAVPRHIPVSNVLPFARNSKGVPTWLGCMLADGGSSQHSYRFTNFDADIVRAMRRACRLNGGNLKVQRVHHVVRRGQFYVDGLRRVFGNRFGIDGKLSVEKTIAPEVFGWSKEDLRELLRAMYGCDGTFSTEKGIKSDGTPKLRCRVIYCTSSHQLAKDVQSLLMRFGLIASIFQFESRLEDHVRPAYRVILQDVRQVERFIKEIGFLGKKQAIAEACLSQMTAVQENSNFDLIPASVWTIIERKMEEQGKSFYGCRRWMSRPDGKSGRGNEGCCGRRGKRINRWLLRKIAEYLDNDAELLAICDQQVYWDEVVSIEPAGKTRVYDISMPTHHNFVADGIVTHNSTLMLNIAISVFERHQIDVLYVPLEMPRNAVFDKILSRETRIPFAKGQRPVDPRTKIAVMTPEEKVRWLEAVDKWSTFPTASFAFLEMGDRTTVGAIRRQIMKHISHHKPRLVVIDYVANLLPDEKRKEGNHLEIGDMLKSMIAMSRPGYLTPLGFHVLTAAQLNRSALTRVRNQRDQTKQILASEDIMGSHHYSTDAANIFGLLEDPNNPKKKIQIFPMKSRYGDTIYKDGSNKGVLGVHAGISLIYSEHNQTWDSTAQDDILTVWNKDQPTLPQSSLAGPDDHDVENQNIEDKMAQTRDTSEDGVKVLTNAVLPKLAPVKPNISEDDWI